MKRRITVTVLTATLLLSMLLGACGSPAPSAAGSAPPQSSSAAGTGGEPSQASSEELKFEDIQFPESLPTGIVMAKDGLYDYDDLSGKYAIEIMLTNYGEQPYPPDKDPINQWLSKQFNMDIVLTAPATADYDTTLSTRFAAGDVPDVFMSRTRDFAFSLSDQGLLLDARNIYPYMKHSNLYTTEGMIQWSMNPVNNEIPFITKYAIQDGVWGLAIRSDWLAKFGMSYPTTRAELMAYAKACTFDDPDGNGINDTYFMTANGNGKDWGMMTGLENMFGNNFTHVDENGQLSHKYFNGVRKNYLGLLKEFYDAGVLAPDWFVLEWEQGRALVANDTVGMVRWPVGALYQQYALEGKPGDMAALDVWDYWNEAPIEGGRYEPNGNPGFIWCFSKAKFEKDGSLDVGKVKRVAHMIDSMTAGNINYFQTIQGSVDEVFEAAGITVEKPRIMEYTDNGSFYVNQPGAAPYTNEAGTLAFSIWQQFGLCVTYQVDYRDPEDPYRQKFADRTEQFYQVLNNYPRWENTDLLVTLSGEAAESMSTNKDWLMAQEYAFVTGARSMDDYDAFAQEWLAKGGKAVIQQSAEQLGVPVPDYGK